MRLFCTFLFLILLPLNLFSQQSIFVGQTYDGITYAPFSLSNITSIKQINAQTLLVRRSGKECHIQINKGEILKIHKKQLSNNGMYHTNYELMGVTVKLPVNANVKEENKEFFTIQYQTHINYYYPHGKTCFEVHLFNKQGQMYRWNLDRSLEIPRDSIDKSKPITVHYIKYDGSEYKITWTCIQDPNAMYNTIPSGNDGNQLNNMQCDQLFQAFRDKKLFSFHFCFINDKGVKERNVLYFDPKKYYDSDK
ncbi:MAG: hypothetical protein J5767_08750 [Paludibacteraceae bacterium]|nr:hypothetical protein [Paludibacteraceae bacterium]